MNCVDCIKIYPQQNLDNRGRYNHWKLLIDSLSLIQKRSSIKNIWWYRSLFRLNFFNRRHLLCLLTPMDSTHDNFDQECLGRLPFQPNNQPAPQQTGNRFQIFPGVLHERSPTCHLRILHRISLARLYHYALLSTLCYKEIHITYIKLAFINRCNFLIYS